MDIPLTKMQNPEYVVQEIKPEVRINNEKAQLQEKFGSFQNMMEEIDRKVAESMYRIKVLFLDPSDKEDSTKFNRWIVENVDSIINIKLEVFGGTTQMFTIYYYPKK